MAELRAADETVIKAYMAYAEDNEKEVAVSMIVGPEGIRVVHGFGRQRMVANIREVLERSQKHEGAQGLADDLAAAISDD